MKKMNGMNKKGMNRILISIIIAIILLLVVVLGIFAYKYWSMNAQAAAKAQEAPVATMTDAEGTQEKPAPIRDMSNKDYDKATCLAMAARDASYCRNENFAESLQEVCRENVMIVDILANKDLQGLRSLKMAAIFKAFEAAITGDVKLCSENDIVCMALATGKEEYCSNKDKNMQQACLTLLYETEAYSKNDASYCEKIAADKDKIKCKATISKNIGLC